MVVNKADNFRSIFNWTDGETEVKGITIPIVQRDYAQGRTTAEVNRIRGRFLHVLYDALVNGKHTTLDFIYGNVEKGQLIPLDGQQRLTTLYLLHYYIARHECVADEEWDFLKNFTYETRVSSREFCQHLVKYVPDFSLNKMSEQIQDEAWFLLEWESDPTVQSMLVMLDAIHAKFCNTDNLWPQLMGDAITFYFLPLGTGDNAINMTDELYIKMNSRGKALTNFEHFKAELELQMKAVDEECAKRIIGKMDREWSDLLWPYRNSGTGDGQADMVTDDEFLRYIHYISDLISYTNDELEIKDEFDIIDKQFSKANPKAADNMLQLESLFDIWTKIPNIDAFFDEYFTTGYYSPGKTKIDKMPNLFKDCCAHYGIIAGRRPQFPLGRFILLYCFVLKLQHKEISDTDFRHRLRIVKNLVNNSVNTLRSDFMKELLLQVDKIILRGVVEQVEEGRARFQSKQMDEEKRKLEWTTEHPDKAETLFRLEDHPYLNGYIKAVGEEHIDWCDRFYSLFSCNLHLVNKALLSIDDYFEKDAWRYRIGIGDYEANKNVVERMWQEMFSPISLEDGLCHALQQLLAERETFNDDYLKERIDGYLNSTQEYPLRYYLVKYYSMRTNKNGKYNNYGKYYWRKHNSWPRKDEAKQRELRLRDYNVILMATEWSTGGFNHDIFLKTLYDIAGKESAGLELDNYSYTRYNEGVDKLRLGKQGKYLTLTDNVYNIYDEEGSLLESRAISQNENGIDTEDRVKVGLQILKKLLGQ
ncbi:MAG: DUF262 domain-containing protein [Prevotella sp.]|nr:DUF262 domain-containing protein [Prevotella sp.]